MAISDAGTTAPASELLVGPAAQVPESRRVAAGVLLLLASCLPLLGATLLTPNLANITRVFAGTPQVDLLVSLVVTAPAAMIGLLSPFAGVISDRLGRKRLLVGAAVLYSVFGVAPVALNSLGGIVVSRLGVGVCEAVILTVATALIADYFEGARRVRYLSLQTVFTTISAVVFVVIGGATAANNWRAPFWLYVAGVILALPLALVVWEPVVRKRSGRSRPMTTPTTVASERVATPWRRLALPLGITLFTGIVLNVTTINLSFILPERGFTGGTAQIGLISAVLAIAMACGALAFGPISVLGPARLLPVSLAAQAVGLGLVAAGGGVTSVVAGGVVAAAGAGVTLPTLIIWTLGQLQDDRIRGRVAGLWTSAFWSGQVVYSFLFTGLVAVTDSRSTAIGSLAAAVAVAAVTAALLVRRQPVGTVVEVTGIHR